MNRAIFDALLAGLKTFNLGWNLAKSAVLWPAFRSRGYSTEFPPVKRIMVLAPHMDDEVIGCGGAIYRHARRGGRTTCVFLTNGAAGLSGAGRESVYVARRRESGRAALVLGIDRLVFCGRPDGHLKSDPDLERRIRDIIDEERPEILLLPYPFDPHPDHRAAFGVLADATRAMPESEIHLLLYQIRTPIPWRTISVVLDISHELSAKREAFAAFASQPEKTFKTVLHLGSCQRFLIGVKPRAVEVFASLSLSNAGRVGYNLPFQGPQVSRILCVGRHALRRGRLLHTHPVKEPNGWKNIV